MNLRALSVDWPLEHPTLVEQGFCDRSSFSSYDAVFIDPLLVSRLWTADLAPTGDGLRRTDPGRDRGFGRTLSGWMRRRRDETGDLLTLGGGTMVCRMHPRGEPLDIVVPGTPAERVDRYSWLPTVSLVDRHHQFSFPSNGRFHPRHGDDVVFEGSGSPFEEYLRACEGRIRYTAVYQDLLSTPVDRFATILARNRVGDILALEIPFDEGRLVLVPSVEGVSPTREATLLLEAVAASAPRPAFSSAPDWLPAYAMPGEDQLVDELTGLTERRDALTAKVEEITAKLEEKTQIKHLLYARGRTLFGGAVKEAFLQLGFDVEDQGETLRLSSDEGTALTAMEASDSAKVGVQAYRRLHRAVDRSVLDGDDPVKGILVVSGSRELDPKRRPTQFLPEVLRGCRAHGYCLVTSYQLFKLVQRAREDRSKKGLGVLRRTLLECDGELRDAGEA